MARRLLIANLDAESEWASMAAREDGRDPQLCALPGKVADRISVIGTVLRVLASDGDLLWTPSSVPEATMTHGLPDVELISGQLPKNGFDDVLAWAETESVADLRKLSPPRSRETPKSGDNLVDAIWSIEPADATVARRVNDRLFCTEIACELGLHQLASTLVTTTEEVKDFRKRHAGDVVLKARQSAAGRDRAILRAGEALHSARVDNLFRSHGSLICERWVERIDDFSVALLVVEHGSRVIGFQTQHLDQAGHIRSISLGPPHGWAPETIDEVEAVAKNVAAHLSKAGYRGAATIDGWSYREADGVKLHPLGEINARLSLGFLLRCLREHQPAVSTLHFGKSAPSDSTALTPPSMSAPPAIWAS